jgi:predicted nucleic acid-binding protein
VVSRVLVDTNVVVSYLLNRSPEQQRRAAELIEAAESPRRRLLLHQLVLAETVFVLRTVYGRPAGEVTATLGKLLELPGSEIVDGLDWPRLLELWPAEFPDFLDASLACAAETLRPDGVATFDRAFGGRLRSRGLPTYWP